ncbi:hypothetical protein BFP70_12730 [Thioclava sp. SK-1]|uniref:outer membrane protein transport protein n=1 Tax=Thioclava sp. SK-1 TaxID=1889770 RepID=UPI0008259C95|nr:outer membrane protein transport protein [Thioclava sp. SK-1]OCX63075.1 hypothetical protein BFP70_12730 [Thioclava sp. SK-1]
MKAVITGATWLALTASTALAGGIERSSQSVGILFEDGNYAEFSMGRVQPKVSGTQQDITFGNTPIVVLPGGGSSGDVAPDYNTYGLSVKTEITEGLHFAMILDEAIGADVSYTNPAYLYGGQAALGLGIPGGTVSAADINSIASTALLRYELPNNFSVIGGVRAIRTKGTVSLFNGYGMTTNDATDFGYVLGVAWEKPEIAARVALTYNSAVTHDFDTTESINGSTILVDKMEVEIPQSVNLEAQTGIMADTLLFGSVKWAQWSKFEIAPPAYMNISNPYQEPLVSHDEDSWTYTLGVGRKFNDTWSGAAFVSHETGESGYSGNLGPTDGNTSLGLAATWQKDNVKITGGVRYVMIGDAETEVPAAIGNGTGNCTATQRDCGTLGKFRDNHAVAFGLRIGFNF